MNSNLSIATGIGDKIKEYGVSLALAGYIAGFIVTSVYLGQYNIANFDIIRARYILTGTMFLIFAFTCLFPAYISWRGLTQELTRELRNGQEKRNLPWQRVWRALSGSFWGNLFSVAAIGIPLYFIISITIRSEIPYVFSYLSIGIFIMNSVFVVFAYGFITILLSLPRDLFSNKPGQELNDADGDMYFQFFVTPIMVVLLLLVIVFAYSFLVYPAMPQQLGGGKPITVEVTYKSHETTQILEILDRTSTTTIFLTEDCSDHTKRAIEVASNEILSMSPVASKLSQCP